MAEHLIKHGRIGCVPGVDFGPSAEGYMRLCFGRSREELTGALASMKETLAHACPLANVAAGDHHSPNCRK